MSSILVVIEELRTKYKIMTNRWLLAEMRQPCRVKDPFTDFLDELLSGRSVP